MNEIFMMMLVGGLSFIVLDLLITFIKRCLRTDSDVDKALRDRDGVAYMRAVHREELQSLHQMLKAKDEYITALQGREHRHLTFITDVLSTALSLGFTGIADMCRRYLASNGGRHG